MAAKVSFETFLVDNQVLSQDSMAAFVKDAQARKISLFQVLIENNVLTDEALAQTLSKFYQVDYAPPPLKFEVDLVKKVPIFTLRRYKILPLSKTDKGIVLAMVDPGNILATDEVRRLLKVEVKAVCTTERALTEALGRAQGAGPQVVQAQAKAPESLVDNAGIISMAEKVLENAFKKRASDIHFEPQEKTGIIRERVDGVLYDVQTVPIETFNPLVARLKLLAGMDVVERRLAQDGRLKMTFGEAQTEIRASTIPTIYGEKMVLRMLRSSKAQPTLAMLELDPPRLALIQKIVDLYEGLVLVAGPTGSGKSTTLYSILGQVDRKTMNVVTVEDPVEYELERANQIQVNNKIGITFSSMLPNLLRQDPDVMLIGEVRDEETAQMVMRAAISGHLVFSTIHAPDAVETVTRITDMGINPHLIVAALKACISQRLLRRLCLKCRKPYPAPEGAKKILGLPLDKEATLYQPVGCDACFKIGYSGRVVVMETLLLTPGMHEAILKNEKYKFREIAIKEGFIPMKVHAVERCLRGETSLQEVLSNCN